MADAVILRGQAKARHRERARANARALAGAGVDEDQILEAGNRWHLAVLEQHLAAGALELHLGMAREYKGLPFCVAEAGQFVWAAESLGAFRSPYFSMRLPESQRWWCGIVWLEQNRGCPSCIRLAYKFADEEGLKQPRRLGELLELGAGAPGPARGVTQSGPRLTREGFTRG